MLETPMLILPAILWREIEERTRRALPNEACGLLLGSTRAEEFEVGALASVRNVAREPLKHFELDPLDMVAAEDAARASGLTIVGVWHSHPRGPLQASAQDDCKALDSNWLSVIAVPKPHSGLELGCWRRAAAGFVKIEVGQPLKAHG